MLNSVKVLAEHSWTFVALNDQITVPVTFRGD